MSRHGMPTISYQNYSKNLQEVLFRFDEYQHSEHSSVIIYICVFDVVIRIRSDKKAVPKETPASATQWPDSLPVEACPKSSNLGLIYDKVLQLPTSNTSSNFFFRFHQWACNM